MEENLNFSANAFIVLKKRYLKKNEKGEVIETPRQLLERVAHAIASVEKQDNGTEERAKIMEKKFLSLLTNLEFMCNSPTLMNAGKELGQLSACFVVPVEDSMESIFEAIKATALIHKTGGGTGFSFSHLRPKNSMVKSTGGVASGPVSFMKVFDSATQAVKQGGTRRGANMGLLRVDHPDILEFITCKEEEGDIPNFNISIAVTENFIQKLLNKEDYELIDPHTGQVHSTLNAEEVFTLIAKYAHKNGEPGVVFIDRINQDNSTAHLGKIHSTNPCVAGDTLVATAKGLLRMKDLVEKYAAGGVEILVDESVGEWQDAGFSSNNYSLVVAAERKCVLRKISKAFKTGVKACYKVVSESGYEVVVTADHGIMTPRGWVEVKNLRLGQDRLFIQPQAGVFNTDSSLPFKVENSRKDDGVDKMSLPSVWSKELGQILGWRVSSDEECSDGENGRVTFTFSDGDGLEYFKGIINRFYGAPVQEVKKGDGVWHLAYQDKCFAQFFKQLGARPGLAGEKQVPASIFTAPQEAVIGFLQGVFSAGGALLNNEKHNLRYARLTSNSLRFIKEVQILLLNLGIKSRIDDRSRQAKLGFKYMDKQGEEKLYLLDTEVYELNISRGSLKIFLEKVGFINEKYRRRSEELKGYSYYAESYADKVVSKEYVGEREVYDLTEPETLSFVTNGFVSRDCGEQPLLPYESCNLGSINLAKMLKKTSDEFEIDWEKLKTTTRLSTRFLDNVIDANRFPLPQIRDNTLRTRKIGLGIMGWATMLGFLGVAYDSEDAISLAKEVMGFIYKHAKEESIDLAKERGIFPAWKGSTWEKKSIRIRNATLTTIAPTGTISIIAGPTSSSIEPNYALCYFRNVLDGEKLLEVDPAFEYMLKREGIYSADLMKKVAAGESIQAMDGISDRIKRVFKTALEISPLWHIKMQSAFQEFTDNAVSKTINLPNSATVEEVKEAYFLAYKLGCKGVTVYRDGSRRVQVLTKDKKKEEHKVEERPFTVSHPKPRPEVILGTTTKVTTGCGNLYITINQDEEGNLFEVFTQMGKAGGCAGSQLEAIGRLISLALRGKLDMKVIVEQLKGIRCPSPSWANGKKIFSCADAIARVLEKRSMDQKEIIKVGQVVQVREGAMMVKTVSSDFSIIVGVCPDCGVALRHQEGCVVCDSCGYSKC